MKHKWILLAGICLMAISTIGAQPAPKAKKAVETPKSPEAVPVKTTPAAEEEAGPEGLYVKSVSLGKNSKGVALKLSGYVDAYYAYHTVNKTDGRPAWSTDGSGGSYDNKRVFEKPSDQFSLGLVQTKFEVGDKNWQVVADLVHGPNAELANFGNVSKTGNSNTSTAIKQAYVAANLADDFKLTVGQFGTHIGYEVVESYLNPNYTLGYPFGYGPFYHTGAKLDYSILDGKVGFMAGVVNGWDSYVDNNGSKSAIGQVSYKPTGDITLLLNYAGGKEASVGTDSWRNIGDLVFQYQINKMFKIGVNLVVGNEKEANIAEQKWGGSAFYFSAALTNNFTLSYRADYFDDKSEIRGLKTAVQGHTLTGTISMYDGHFLIRPEVKHDIADRAFFGNATDLKKENTTLLVAFTGVY